MASFKGHNPDTENKVNKRNIPVVSFHLAQLFPRGRACTIDAIDNFDDIKSQPKITR
jgi:hypothetical protein